MRSVLTMTCGALVFALALGVGAAEATVNVAIDLTHQRMHVTSPSGTYDWPISSARSGFTTPGGSFAPIRLERMHYSKKYHMSPMPYSIFFRGGFAIHGTYAVSELGHPASHGCVRLSPGHAAALYGMIQAQGARISISGTPPASRPFATHDVARNDRGPGQGLARHGRRYAEEPDDATPPARYSRDRLAPLDRGAAYGATYGYVPAPTYGYGYRPPETYTPAYIYAEPAGEPRY